MIEAVERPLPRTTALPTSFNDWRSSVAKRGALPVIAIAGSRGKTTVARLLEAMFNEAGLKCALWTNLGVEIAGDIQEGELVPWSTSLRLLASGTLDVAIQELDWATVHAVGLPPNAYSLTAVTNLCVNSESCLLQDDTQLALQSLGSVFTSTRDDGVVVLNGEDFAVAGDGAQRRTPAVLVGLNRDTPLIRDHLSAGGMAAWIEGKRLRIGTDDTNDQICTTTSVALALKGAVGFELHNALTAAATARACGIPLSTVSRVLRRFVPGQGLMPGSFNVVPIGGATVIVDRPAPSWFMRHVMRAVTHLPFRRILAVVGRLSTVSDDDLAEVGRLLGRVGGAMIVHGADESPARSAAFRQGISLNDVPPFVISTGSEADAIDRALKMVRPDDLVLVLAERPANVLRMLAAAKSVAGPDGDPPPDQQSAA
jgi:cyanophycin synthetase